MKRTLAFLILSFVALGAVADDEPIEKPIRYTWIASSCETWNCAAAALVLANGDKYVMVLPTGREEQPWIVLRRVEEGSIFVPDEEPYECNVFTTVDDAAIKYSVTDTCHAPMILNVPDGRAVIASLKSCGSGSSKKRSVR
ncbi:MAG TPA: hypothetical protein VHW00_16460 [Thermoanaerobaculia bacterium]|nr:hypothetical protein [Thermoanaerobaculia bacterium]